MATGSTLQKVLLMLKIAYPDAKLEEKSPKLYERMLADIPDEVLEQATLDHISRSQWFPKISELRRAAARLTGGIEQQQTGIEAWNDVNTAIRTLGRGGDPEFRNPVTAHVVRMMGWRDLCMSENQISDRARFIDAYDQFQTRAVSEAVSLPSVRELARKFTPQLQSGWYADNPWMSEGGQYEYDGSSVRPMQLLEDTNADLLPE